MTGETPSDLRAKPHPAPDWMRAADGAAEFLIALILAGGFLSRGYAEAGPARGWAFAGCALLGAWAAVGAALGRWSGPWMRPARLWIGVWAAAAAVCALQILPLPWSLAVKLSPVWAESGRAFEAAGIPVPDRIPLAQNPARAADSFAQLLAWGFFAACATMLASRRRCAGRLALIAAAAGLLEGWWGAAAFGLGAGRAHGALYNPNHHAAFVASALPLFFAVLTHARRSSPAWAERSLLGGTNPFLFLYGCGLLMAAGWLASISRGSLIFGGAVLGLWAAAEAAGRWRELRTDGVVAIGGRTFAAGALAFTVLLLGLTLLVRTAGLAGDFQARWDLELGGHSRRELWRATWKGLMDSPWTGLGPGGTEHALTRHSSLPAETAPVWSHNDFVQLFCELGLPGAAIAAIAALAFGSAFVSETAWRTAHFPWSRGMLQRGALAGALSALAHSITDFPLRLPMMGFLFALMTAVAAAPGALLLSPGELARLANPASPLRLLSALSIKRTRRSRSRGSGRRSPDTP